VNGAAHDATSEVTESERREAARLARKRRREEARRQRAELAREAKDYDASTRDSNAAYRKMLGSGATTTGAIRRMIIVPVILLFLGLIALLFGGHNSDWRWMVMTVELAVFWIVLIVVNQLLPRAVVLVVNIVIILMAIVVMALTFLSLWSRV